MTTDRINLQQQNPGGNADADRRPGKHESTSSSRQRHSARSGDRLLAGTSRVSAALGRRSAGDRPVSVRFVGRQVPRHPLPAPPDDAFANRSLGRQTAGRRILHALPQRPHGSGHARAVGGGQPRVPDCRSPIRPGTGLGTRRPGRAADRGRRGRKRHVVGRCLLVRSRFGSRAVGDGCRGPAAVPGLRHRIRRTADLPQRRLRALSGPGRGTPPPRRPRGDLAGQRARRPEDGRRHSRQLHFRRSGGAMSSGRDRFAAGVPLRHV